MAYFGNHSNKLHKCGGYTSNERGALGYSPEMDRQDGQMGLLKVLERNYMVSQKQADYRGHQSKTPDTEFCLPGSLFFGRSGYANSAGALHRPTIASINATKIAQIGSTYDPSANLNSSCLVPESMLTETKEKFNQRSLEKGPWKPSFGDPMGNRDTGYTSSISTCDPIMWRQTNPTYDHSSDFIQPRMNITSVSHTDFLVPREKRSGAEPTPLISSKPSAGSGFVNANELKPCFIPPTKVYGLRDRAHDDPDHFITNYTIDYPRKSAYCDPTGLRIVGQKPAGTAAAAMESNISFDYGHINDNRTESVHSFTQPWPLPGASTLWLGRPVEGSSSSGFTLSTKRHVSPIGNCGESPFDNRDNSAPQRYNPWPRLTLGHKQMTHNTFRPHPITYGTDYGIYTAAPTTSNDSTTYLY